MEKEAELKLEYDKLAQQIFIQRNVSVRSMPYMVLPDNVMIHCSKRYILEYSLNLGGVNYTNQQPSEKRFMNMKVIYTDAIGEDEVICTYNGPLKRY